MATPSDPLFTSQWHFDLIGNIQAIWNDYNGAGVNVGVYDEGVDYNHADLAANYDYSLHVVDDSLEAVDPFPVGDAAHGTACAGLIGAANNSVGGVGVAYGVTLAGVNIDFDNTGVYGSVNGDLEPFLNVIGQASGNFDITSHSWGSTPMYYSGEGLLDDGFAASLDIAYGTLSDEGRNGLGTIVVQAAGNDNLDGNGNGTNASRFTITVAATEYTGFAADYSNFGACILVTAPAAGVTTDISGDAGYDYTDYTDSFSGTSAATPVVSGVVALMFQANNELGWRDVQNILATSATLTGSEFDASVADGAEDGLWYSNSNSNWNGGGNHVHTNYGYGMVNAFNAVRMAEVWDLFNVAQTSSNEQSVTSDVVDFESAVVEEGTGVGYTTTFTIDYDIQIEHLALTLDFEAGWVGDMRIVMSSAAGTEFVVTEGNDEVDTEFDGTWVFGIDALRGELSAGTWTMTIYDLVALDTLTINSASLEVFGSSLSEDDVYHFTDEYADMIGFDEARGIIADLDDGEDWLNMAAVTANIILNMTSGETFSFDEDEVGELSGSFENIVTGDGDDSITGNASANEIRGMRGNDTLSGGGGADTLMGGKGNDTYVVGSAWVKIVEGSSSGTDTVMSSISHTLGQNLEQLTLTGTSAINGTGNSANNIITGNDASNRLNGKKGADTLIGGLGDDIYVTDGNDTITESATGGTDTVQSSATYTLAANIEKLTLTGSSAINGTGNAADNTITGNTGANTLNGAAGADTLNGGSGADKVIGGTGIDQMTGAGGNDTFIFNNVVESAITATTADVITDFVSGRDKINLSAIDAFASSSTNDAFIWKGSANFNSTSKGEVRFQIFDNAGEDNDYTMIWIDNDADTAVEMAICLTGLYSLTASDFIL
jgi:Ca2+-binding RTX toxin-like protein